MFEKYEFQNLGRKTLIEAANGKSLSAMKIFSTTLGYFKDHALQELRDATGTKIAQVHKIITAAHTMLL